MIDTAKLSERCAQSLSRRWGGRHDWRELVGACWEGIDRAIRAGATEERLLRHAARCAAMTALRDGARGGWSGRDRVSVRPVSAVVGAGEAGYGTLEPAAPDRPDADRRALALWCECRAERAEWTWAMRVRVYLHAVEGMTLAEIAALSGTSLQSIHQSISAATRARRRARQTTSPQG